MKNNYLASIRKIIIKTEFLFINIFSYDFLKSHRLKIGMALLVSTTLSSSCSNNEQSKTEKKEKPEEEVITCYAAQFEEDTVIKDTILN
ncbi:MAG: hypothetical protein JXR58_03335 [Bacteroidales bacterium]|nr:hypothetical protein [Bacteroidales bacterium]